MQPIVTYCLLHLHHLLDPPPHYHPNFIFKADCVNDFDELHLLTAVKKRENVSTYMMWQAEVKLRRFAALPQHKLSVHKISLCLYAPSPSL